MAVEILRSCFNESNVPLLNLCSLINLYVEIFFLRIVSHIGRYEITRSTPLRFLLYFSAYALNIPDKSGIIEREVLHMNTFTLMFGDRRLEEYGRSLLKFFEQEDFPKAILKYPELNLIYCRAKYDKNHDEYSQELLDYLDVMLALRREEMGQESKDADS